MPLSVLLGALRRWEVVCSYTMQCHCSMRTKGIIHISLKSLTLNCYLLSQRSRNQKFYQGTEFTGKAWFPLDYVSFIYLFIYLQIQRKKIKSFPEISKVFHLFVCFVITFILFKGRWKRKEGSELDGNVCKWANNSFVSWSGHQWLYDGPILSKSKIVDFLLEKTEAIESV